MSDPAPFQITDQALARALERDQLVTPELLRGCLREAETTSASLGELLLAKGFPPDRLEEAYRLLPSPSRGPLHTGEVVALRYRVDSILGSGGMGAVYRVTELGSARALALKVVLPDLADEVDLLRFQREAEVTARLSSASGFVRVHSGGQHRGLPYFVMDLVEGRDLESALKTGLPHEELAQILAAVADALQSGHDADLIHRDLKPANVLLGLGGPRVADLGLVRDRDAQTLTQSGEILGTPAYMAPEQVQDARRVDARTDVYALGAILYTGLAGRPPFSGGWIKILNQVVSEEPPRPSRVRGSPPTRFEGICLKAMAKDPSERYPSAAAFAEDLRRALGGTLALAPPWRRGALPLAGALVVVGLAGSALWFFANHDRGVSSSSPSPTAPEAAGRVRALAKLSADYDTLFEAGRIRRSLAIRGEANRIQEGALEAGLSEDEIRGAKILAWSRAAPSWRESLEGLARSPGAKPDAAMEVLRDVLLAPPSLGSGVAEVSSQALSILLEREDSASHTRAVKFQTARIPFGLAAPPRLQQRVHARFRKAPRTYPDCLRVGVPLNDAQNSRRLAKLSREPGAPGLPPGQARSYVKAAQLAPDDWSKLDRGAQRALLNSIVDHVLESLDEGKDLAPRYVVELHYLSLRARSVLAELDLREGVGQDPSGRLAGVAFECGQLRKTARGVMVFELAEVENGIWLVLEEPGPMAKAWEGAIKQLKREVEDSPPYDCPELQLARAYRFLGYAKILGGSPRESLEDLQRCLDHLPGIKVGMLRIGVDAGGHGERLRRKVASLRVRAYLDLGDLGECERLLAPHLNTEGFRADHDLGDIAVRVAIARRDRDQALKRFALFSALEGEEERIGDLRKLIAKELPPK